jgi:hypothetical protein
MRENFFLLYYLTQVKESKYKNYEIDKGYNFRILSNLYEIDKIAYENNLNYFITGSCALVLSSDEIYRTIQDIDIVVHINELPLWIEALKNVYDYYYLSDPLEFFKYCLDNDRLLPFIHKENKLKLEIAPVNDNYMFNTPIYEKQIYHNTYRLILPLKMKKNEKYFYGRERDKDDIDFYSSLVDKATF